MTWPTKQGFRQFFLKKCIKYLALSNIPLHPPRLTNLRHAIQDASCYIFPAEPKVEICKARRRGRRGTEGAEVSKKLAKFGRNLVERCCMHFRWLITCAWAGRGDRGDSFDRRRILLACCQIARRVALSSFLHRENRRPRNSGKKELCVGKCSRWEVSNYCL